jgi:hypothetical protein
MFAPPPGIRVQEVFLCLGVAPASRELGPERQLHVARDRHCPYGFDLAVQLFERLTNRRKAGDRRHGHGDQENEGRVFSRSHHDPRRMTD